MLKSAEVEIQKVLMVNKTTKFKKQGKPKKDLKKGGKKPAAHPEKPKGGPKPDTECYYCNGKGHWKRNCSKYFADLKSGLVKKKKGISDIHVIDVYLTGSRTSACGHHDDKLGAHRGHEVALAEFIFGGHPHHQRRAHESASCNVSTTWTSSTTTQALRQRRQVPAQNGRTIEALSSLRVHFPAPSPCAAASRRRRWHPIRQGGYVLAAPPERGGHDGRCGQHRQRSGGRRSRTCGIDPLAKPRRSGSCAPRSIFNTPATLQAAMHTLATPIA
ncbi:hypothetical protein QYE76_042541 [Lolium multiflorum]|uniref:CCHC-type domain-containing protein n=1 Tax=Lolium multiflorum TaxID=4521 RepID=A0AAD8WXE5_LOLMU|nr:hypothetical protein QYE76_042541 [Lolium multiflorum]